jgi:Rrf2 family protein
MRFSARTEYAAIAALALACHGESRGPLTMRAICEAHGVPAQFLVHILLQLKRAGLVVSVRGASGGYRLARPSDAITLRDIHAAVDGAAESSAPVTAALASRTPLAAVLARAWNGAAAAHSEALEAVTLADLTARMRIGVEPMYYI